MHSGLRPLLAFLLLPGCGGAGTYFKDRGRDLLDPWRLEAGLQSGIGADGKGAGLLHLGFGAWMVGPNLLLGARYGRPCPSDRGYMTMEGHFPFAGVNDGLGGRFFLHDEARNLYKGAADPGGHGCWWILPCLLSTESEPPRAVDRFDLEVSAVLLLLGAGAGVRLGEFADFLGGWFGWDPAGDDAGAPKPPPKKKRKGAPPPDGEITPEMWRFFLVGRAVVPG